MAWRTLWAGKDALPETIETTAEKVLLLNAGGGEGRFSLAVGPAGTIYAADGEIAFGGFSALRADAPLARSPWPKVRGNARNTGNLQDAALQPSHEQRPSNEKSTIQ